VNTATQHTLTMNPRRRPKLQKQQRLRCASPKEELSRICLCTCELRPPRPVSASPTLAPGMKTHSSPAAFPTALSVPPSFSCLRLHWLPSGPWSPQNRYGAASGKNAAARPPALIRSTPRQHYLVGRPTMRRPHMQEYLSGEKCCKESYKEESLSGSGSIEAWRRY
jgi:hypothetical protein